MKHHGISWSLLHMQKRGALAPQPPSVVVAPSVTPILAEVGTLLTCNPGTWTGFPAPTITQKWQSDGVDISGATGLTFTATAGEVDTNITCLVTATNIHGASSVPSNVVPVIETFDPVNTSPPTILGDPVAGNLLTCLPGTWDTGPFPAPTFTYQWLLDGVNIGGATSNTYTPLSSQAGQMLSCRVTATHDYGTANADSAGLAVKLAPVNQVAPTVTGIAAVGQTLTVTQGTWGGYPPPTLTNQWLKNGVEIAGQTGLTYVAVAGDSGATISCRVTGTNSVGSSSAVSNGLVIGAALSAPVNTAAPVVSGIPQVGQTLSSTTGTWTGNPTPTFTYQWTKNGVDIGGATSSTYLLPASTPGDLFRCRVTATNSQGSASATSNALTFELTPSAPVNTLAPSVTPTVAYGAGVLLSSTSGTWTGHPTPTYTYQWQRDGVNIGGATASTYTTVAGDVNTNVRCRVTATNSQGSASANSNNCFVTPDVDRLLQEDGVSFVMQEDGVSFIVLE